MAALREAIPLAQDAHGVYRIGGTRVTLDLVVRAFNRGATAEEIAQRYPALNLADIYQVLGHYLKHQSDLDTYLKSREEQAETLRQSHPEWSPAGLRDRLLARRNSR
jgi:uncharacterized protein (DUF433 family)